MTTIDSDLSQQQKQQQEQCIGKTSFVTTTDVMNTINETLHSLYDSSSTTTTSSTIDSKPSYFELHRRLPDGSIRKASEMEQAAVDCHTCIQQAIQQVTTFTTIQQQYEWVEQQRMYGNQFYQNQQYEMAIQIYLTCLPAILTKQQQQQQQQYDDDDDKPNHSIYREKDDMNDSSIQQQQEEEEQQRLLLFCKIMNNLAQSTLQLQWYRKTETFCTMALDYLKEQQQQQQQQQLSSSFEENNNWMSTTTTTTTTNSTYMMLFLLEQIIKLYYRRGKARRYRGEYQLAQHDLQSALHHITTATTTTTTVFGLEQRRIQNELQLIYKQMKQEKHNQQKFQKSLQTILSFKEDTVKEDTDKQKNTLQQPKRTKTKTNLHSTNCGLFGNDTYVVPTKSYSTLRARVPRQQHPMENNPLISNHHHHLDQENKNDIDKEKDSNDDDKNQTITTTTMLENVLSYWDYYICMLRNGAISILVMLFSPIMMNQNKS